MDGKLQREGVELLASLSQRKMWFRTTDMDDAVAIGDLFNEHKEHFNQSLSSMVDKDILMSKPHSTSNRNQAGGLDSHG